MNPEDVTKLLKLTEENQKLLQKIRKGQVIQLWVRGIYLFIMVAFVYGGYVFLKPVVQNLMGTYSDAFNLTGSAQDAISAETGINVNQLNDLIQSFK